MWLTFFCLPPTHTHTHAYIILAGIHTGTYILNIIILVKVDDDASSRLNRILKEFRAHLTRAATIYAHHTHTRAHTHTHTAGRGNRLTHWFLKSKTAYWTPYILFAASCNSTLSKGRRPRSSLTWRETRGATAVHCGREDRFLFLRTRGESSSPVAAQFNAARVRVSQIADGAALSDIYYNNIRGDTD